MNFIIFLISLTLSLILVPLTIKISSRFNIVSNPTKTEPAGKPCIGGIGIYAAFLIASFLGFAFVPMQSMHRFMVVIISSSIIIILGVMDDLNDLRPSFKIIGEIAAILFVVLNGMYTQIAFLPKWLNITITFIWFLFITNAFNLLDIMDGLTSGLVIIISGSLLFISWVNNDIFSVILLISLIGAYMGFLRYNYPSARLYMGDTGSLFAGFILALLAINIDYSQEISRPIALIAPIMAMSLPIYDTMFLILMRMKKNKPIFTKTDDHFALRLIVMGYSIKKSLLIMYAFSLFLAVSSLIIAFGSNITGIFCIALSILVFIIMGKKVGMVKIED